MNTIIYIRVSTTEQAELGTSLKSQEEICRDYAKRNNYDVSKVFIERGESAKTTNRTELRKLLDFIQFKYNEIDYLIVFKLDRLARNLLDYTNPISILSKYGIILKSATETIGETPEGKLMENIIASFAQYDNDQKSQRTLIGMKQAVKDGRWIWLAPFGYKRERINNKSFIVFSKDKKIVENIFNDFLNGKKQYEIVEDLKNNGIKISATKVAYILSNIIYTGKIKTSLFEELIQGVHKPIIDEAIFYRVQDILNKKPKEFHQVIKSGEFALTRFLKCPYCNRRLKGSWSQGRHKKYPYYHCTNKGCLYKPLKKETTENIFAEYIKSIEPTNEVLDNFINATKEYNSNAQADSKKRIKILNKELKELDHKKERIEELAIDGTFTKERFQKKISVVEEELVNKKIAIEDLQKDTIDLDSLLNYSRYFLKNLSKLWLNSAIEGKRKLQDYIFPDGIYIENNRCRTAKISTIF
ncbi:MAG: recombinase family protein [Candidatus Humimicrobiaceae bacterium]